MFKGGLLYSEIFYAAFYCFVFNNPADLSRTVSLRTMLQTEADYFSPDQY